MNFHAHCLQYHEYCVLQLVLLQQALQELVCSTSTTRSANKSLLVPDGHLTDLQDLTKDGTTAFTTALAMSPHTILRLVAMKYHNVYFNSKSKHHNYISLSAQGLLQLTLLFPSVFYKKNLKIKSSNTPIQSNLHVLSLLHTITCVHCTVSFHSKGNCICKGTQQWFSSTAAHLNWQGATDFGISIMCAYSRILYSNFKSQSLLQDILLFSE